MSIAVSVLCRVECMVIRSEKVENKNSKIMETHRRPLKSRIIMTEVILESKSRNWRIMSLRNEEVTSG